MSRKKKRRNKQTQNTKNNQLITLESSLNRIKTLFEDKALLLNNTQIASGVRKRIMTMDFDMLRKTSEKLSVVNMCVNCREQQITPFLKPADEIGDTGFVIHKKGELNRRMKSNDKVADSLTEMVQNTGFIEDPKREDDFIDFGKQFIREVLTIDQVAVELQRNRRNEIISFWLVDGATISRCIEEGYEGRDEIAYVQLLNDKVVAEYTRDDLIFDYMFKRVDIKHRGFGYSLLEQAVDLITTLIFGITYNRDMFIKDKVPKGFIAVQGEADDEAIEAISRYWYAAMSGMGGKFKIPVLPSGKDGTALEFKRLQYSNRDLEYHKLMLFFLSLFAGVFGIDLAEFGIKTDNSQPLIGENIEGRLNYSKDRALRALLSFFSGFMNKIIMKINPDYNFTIVGIDPEDDVKKYDISKRAIESTRTINEMREEDGLEPLEGEEYNTVLNQNLIQYKQLMESRQAREDYEKDTGDDTGDEGQTEDEEQEDKEDKEDKEEPPEDIEKAISEINAHIEELKKSGYEVEIGV